MNENGALFSAINQVLARGGLDLDAAQAHGILCGVLSYPPASADTLWWDLFIEHARKDEQHAQISLPALRQLKQFTQDSLCSPDCAVMLLLPSDSAPLAERTAALARFCQGFLYGLGIAAGSARAHNPPATPAGNGIPGFSAMAQEFVRDMEFISRAHFQEQEENLQESAYAELVEYIRAGLLLLQEER